MNIFKQLFLTLLCCGVLFASQFTTLSDTTLTNPDGSLFTGTVTVSWPSYSSLGVYHMAGHMQFNVASGVINVSLPANDQFDNKAPYSVSYTQAGKPTFTTTWFFPTTSSTLTLSQVQAPASSGGGSSTRTWYFGVQGLCQNALAGAGLWLPTSNAPSFNACTSTTQQGEWTVAAGATSTNWGLQMVVPAGATGAWTGTLIWRSADNSGGHSVVLTPSYSCVSAGSAPDNPSYTTLSTVTLTAPATASANSLATFTFTPTCSTGSQLRLLLTSTTNTLTSPAQFSYESISLQASN